MLWLTQIVGEPAKPKKDLDVNDPVASRTRPTLTPGGPGYLRTWVRTAVASAAVVVALVALMACASQALAAPAYSSLRGSDRYQTAVVISKAGFSPGVSAVVIASGEDFTGALVAAPLAGAYRGPLLLSPSTGLPDAVKAELARLAPAQVIVVGLTPGILDEAKAALPGLDPAKFVAITGVDAYETSANVARQLKTKLGTVPGVVIAPGDSFPDGLAVSPLAAVKGWPIILTPTDGPFPVVCAEAISDLGVTTGVEVGSYVDPGLPSLTRLVGADRYATGALIADYGESQGLSYSHVAVTTGENYPDALAVGPYLALDAGILLLTASSGLPVSTSNLVMAHASEIGRVDLVGLSDATSAKVAGSFPLGDLPPGSTCETLKRGSQGPQVLWVEQKLSDLTYRPGGVDGTFDARTYEAVLAFQKVEGLKRTGIVDSATWASFLTASPPSPRYAYSGTRIEIDMSRQVLLYIQNGVVTKTLPCSTGKPGWETTAGSYQINYKDGIGWVTGALGRMYSPCNVYPHHYIHGSESVPAYAASHGCIRVTVWDMDELYPQLFRGMRVNISY